MSYLVICPTCGGKMSVNAANCPHCGETEFYKKTSRIVTKIKTCDYSSSFSKDNSCENGYIYANYVFVPPRGSGLSQSDIEAINRSNSWVKRGYYYFYNKVKCTQCGGTGQIKYEETEYQYTDLRRKVI